MGTEYHVVPSFRANNGRLEHYPSQVGKYFDEKAAREAAQERFDTGSYEHVEVREIKIILELEK